MIRWKRIRWLGQIKPDVVGLRPLKKQHEFFDPYLRKQSTHKTEPLIPKIMSFFDSPTHYRFKLEVVILIPLKPSTQRIRLIWLELHIEFREIWPFSGCLPILRYFRSPEKQLKPLPLTSSHNFNLSELVFGAGCTKGNFLKHMIQRSKMAL